MTNKMAILLALVLGVVAALAMHAWMRAQAQAREEAHETVQVLVARKAIRENETLKFQGFAGGEMVRFASFPQDYVVTGMIPRHQAHLVQNFIANRRIEAGEPIRREDLEPPYERAETTASVVDEGKRAVTIPVDMVSGVAGLIRPGDRVDIAVTFDIRRGETAGSEEGVLTVDFLENVRVIALDSRTETVRTTQDVRRRSGVYRAVTLELSPEDALRLVNAQEQGRIRLMLRNRRDTAVLPQAERGEAVGVNVVTHELGRVTPLRTSPRGAGR